ncbi:hypothetical protein Hypma_002655 [Hypsizygus marmoreus]|uniref:Uncharacterized protein n=1 Tax=Hypsizygus marmoreus TaxID=39966 RepID=A0A369JDQ4_HYPMA|nr:hypothetical protein Hypma_002655 [Hypsizygus marmoreus]
MEYHTPIYGQAVSSSSRRPRQSMNEELNSIKDSNCQIEERYVQLQVFYQKQKESCSGHDLPVHAKIDSDFGLHCKTY